MAAVVELYPENDPRTTRMQTLWQRFSLRARRFAYPLWIASLAIFALAHALHLRADFPNFSPWEDWSKYTDEGWYGSAAIRAHLFGNWYIPGDFNPAPAVPVWPFLLWILFSFTGVTPEAARGLAVAFFLINLFLSYKLLRDRAPRWVGLLAVTLLVTSPFIYSFSRLAILEPLLLTFTLTAMNLAIRLPRFRYPEASAALIGLLFTGMLLTKTTAVFLLPALAWMIALPFWQQKRRMIRMLAAAGVTAAVSFSLWMLVVINAGLYADYKYLFFVNNYKRETTLYARMMSFWWSFHGGLWVDAVLIPGAGVLILAAIGGAIRATLRARRAEAENTNALHLAQSRLMYWKRVISWTDGLWGDPVFSGSVLAAAGYIGFMTYQNHPQPRYYVVVAFFSFFVVARVAAQLLYDPRQQGFPRAIGSIILALALATAGFNGVWTLHYILHPQYTFLDAAQNLTHYIDQHPNGNRMLVSISGDQITLATHLPSLCDDFGTQDLASKLARYQPGWYAAWNDLDPGTLEDIHNHFSLEQVASFPAFDDPERNVLYLFKLHPLPDGQDRDPSEQWLQVPLPGDKIDIPIE